MNEGDLELLLYRILSGKIIFSYKNIDYELRSANYDIRYNAQVIYNNILNDEKYNDWLREEDLDYILINLGLWNNQTKKMIKNLEKSIDKTKIELYKSASSPAKNKTIRKTLNTSRDQLNRILNHRHEMFNNTLEGYASSIKHEYIICNTLYKDNIKVFPFSGNNNSHSYIQFNNLVNEVNKQNLSIETYKKLARSGIWRSYWSCNKNYIFDKSVAEWTDDQRTLVSMSRMYDNIYEHPECPSDNIIEDDDMLDGWILHQKQEIAKAKKQSQLDQTNNKLKNAQEIFLMANNNEEMEEIISLNSDESLNKMKSKINYVQRVGEASESQLPDVQLEIRSQLAQMSQNRK